MLLASLPADARVWFFVSNRTLTDGERADVLSQAHSFLGEWTSHGRPVHGEAELLHGGVLVVGARIVEDELNTDVSGCGIDALSHTVEAIAANLKFGWTEALEVLYYDADDVLQTISRSEFRRRAIEGAVTSESLVLDFSLTSVGELRTHGIKRLVADSWHGGLLRLALPT